MGLYLFRFFIEQFT